MMERKAVNPWDWSAGLGYNQGEVVTGKTRTLYCAGQTATSSDGKPQHAGEMGAQIALCLENLEAVLRGAEMTLANVVKLNVYATDVDQLFQHYGVLVGRLSAAGNAPPITLLGVSRLALPDLMVELEATAIS